MKKKQIIIITSLVILLIIFSFSLINKDVFINIPTENKTKYQEKNNETMEPIEEQEPEQNQDQEEKNDTASENESLTKDNNLLEENNNKEEDEDSTVDDTVNNEEEPKKEENEKEEEEKEESEIEKNYAKLKKQVQQEIIDEYKISVLIDEFAHYNHYGVSASQTTKEDEVVVYEALLSIKQALSNIPQSILDTLRLERGFHIHLLKDIPTGAAGLAVFSPMSSQKIVIDTDLLLVERIVYHEIFHIMDRYMYWENGQKEAFENWESYNPIGFNYGIESTQYTQYYKTASNSDITFVSKYAKTNKMEDKAELFTDLMFRTYKKNYMESGYGINEKAKYLDEIIDDYFGEIKNAHWERWITY